MSYLGRDWVKETKQKRKMFKRKNNSFFKELL